MGVLQTVVEDAVKRDVSGDGGTSKSAEQSSGGESLLKHFRAFGLFDLKHRQTGRRFSRNTLTASASRH